MTGKAGKNFFAARQMEGLETTSRNGCMVGVDKIPMHYEFEQALKGSIDLNKKIVSWMS